MGTVDRAKPYSEEGYALMARYLKCIGISVADCLEEIDQESLEIELQLRQIPFDSKQQLQVFYRDRLLKKRYVPDLIAFERIVVELKAVSALAREHEAQLLNCMRITRQPVGYLINFGSIDKLEWKRFVLSEFIEH